MRPGAFHFACKSLSHVTMSLCLTLAINCTAAATRLKVICDYYTVPKTVSSEVMEYARFLDDVDMIFTKKVHMAHMHACLGSVVLLPAIASALTTC